MAINLLHSLRESHDPVRTWNRPDSGLQVDIHLRSAAPKRGPGGFVKLLLILNSHTSQEACPALSICNLPLPTFLCKVGPDSEEGTSLRVAASELTNAGSRTTLRALYVRNKCKGRT